MEMETPEESQYIRNVEAKLTSKAQEFLPEVRVEFSPGTTTSTSPSLNIIRMGKLESTEGRTLAVLAHEMGHIARDRRFPKEVPFPKAPTDALRYFLRELNASIEGEKFATEWGVAKEYYSIESKGMRYLIRRMGPKSLLLLPMSLDPAHIRALARYHIPLAPTSPKELLW